MNSGQADQMVIASAAVTGGVYAWLKWQGETSTPVATFTTAWGVVYVSLSVISIISPAVAAGFALLVLTADLLSQGKTITAAITKLEQPTVAAKGATK